MRDEPAIVADLAKSLLRLDPQNLVERPWGGDAIRSFKGLAAAPEARRAAGMPIGESFEIAACDADHEASLHPSRLVLEDGSGVALPAVLARHAETLLGAAFTRRYGSSYPLLPKLLDIRELLSVQAHPPGNTEVYVIIAADPGATIRVGFNRDIPAAALRSELHGGAELQQLLVETLEPEFDEQRLQSLLAPWFAERHPDEHDVMTAIEPHVVADGRGAAAAVLSALKHCYWSVLDSMNEIPVEAGMTIYNATPARLLADGEAPSAEVHALGNPEGRAILALEIRRPGPTFRAWDNVRFPRREVDVDAAVRALNLRATDVDEFVFAPAPVDARPGVLRGIESGDFSIEHLRPAPGLDVSVDDTRPHSLHVLDGSASVVRADGTELGTLVRGETVIVPVRVGGYRVAADAEDVDIVRVSLPVDA